MNTKIKWDKDELALLKQHINTQTNQNRPEADKINDAQKAVLKTWRQKEDIVYHSVAKRMMIMIQAAPDLTPVAVAAPVVIVERKKAMLTVFEDQADLAVLVLKQYGLDIPEVNA